MGKAFEITPKIITRVKSLAKQGLTKYQIAASLGIHRDTLNEKEKKHPDLSDAIEEGKQLGIAEVVSVLKEKAIDGDIAAMKYYLNNRGNEDWKDKQVVESTVTVNMHEDLLDRLDNRGDDYEEYEDE